MIFKDRLHDKYGRMMGGDGKDVENEFKAINRRVRIVSMHV